MQAKIQQIAMVLVLLSPLSISAVFSEENTTAPIPLNPHQILMKNLISTFYASFSIIRGTQCEYRISPRQKLNDIFRFTLKIPCGIC